MGENHEKPSAEQIKGSVKEAIGKLTGDRAVEAEGRAQKRAVRPSPDRKR